MCRLPLLLPLCLFVDPVGVVPASDMDNDLELKKRLVKERMDRNEKRQERKRKERKVSGNVPERKKEPLLTSLFEELRAQQGQSCIFQH